MTIKRNITILGTGTWGIALARMLSRNGHQVTAWSKFPAEVEQLTATRAHPNLPGMTIPEDIRFTTDMASACEEADVLLFAVPSVFVRENAEAVRPYVKQNQLIVDVAKGIEAGTLLTMTQIIGQVLAEKHPRLVALSGPTHAEEVAMDVPTSIVAAGSDMDAAEQVQDMLMNTCMRTYTNRDVLGVELCGALKNIVALASGISAGLGYGDNSRAALITRGMVEITRLGMAMGCQEQTFSGLAGVGDLIVTATSVHSRNNQAGLLIGQGMKPADAILKVGMVVEGVNAIPAALQLAARYGVEMPIVSAVDAIVNRGVDAGKAARALMTRNRKSEYVQQTDESPFSNDRAAIFGIFDRMDWRMLETVKRAATLGDELQVGLMTDACCQALGLDVPAQSYEARRAVLEMLRGVSTVFPLARPEELPAIVAARRIRTVAVAGEVPEELARYREEGLEIISLARRDDG